MIRSLAALALLATVRSVSAADFTIQPVTIAIPAGFEGPIRQEQQGATVVGFMKKSTGSNAKTLLQITLYDFGSRLGNISETDRASAASKYLLDFAGGVERRRSSFERTEPAPVTISGLPAAKLRWRGKLQGVDTVGVMYCLLVGTKVISFHTQDLGSVPTEAMNQAIKAFEAARVAPGG